MHLLQGQLVGGEPGSTFTNLVSHIRGGRHPVESLDRGRKLLDVRHHRVAGRVQDGRDLVLVQAFQAPAVHVNKLETRRTEGKPQQ